MQIYCLFHQHQGISPTQHRNDEYAAKCHLWHSPASKAWLWLFQMTTKVNKTEIGKQPSQINPHRHIFCHLLFALNFVKHSACHFSLFLTWQAGCWQVVEVRFLKKYLNSGISRRKSFYPEELVYVSSTILLLTIAYFDMRFPVWSGRFSVWIIYDKAIIRDHKYKRKNSLQQVKFSLGHAHPGYSYTVILTSASPIIPKHVNWEEIFPSTREPTFQVLK